MYWGNADDKKIEYQTNSKRQTIMIHSIVLLLS